MKQLIKPTTCVMDHLPTVKHKDVNYAVYICVYGGQLVSGRRDKVLRVISVRAANVEESWELIMGCITYLGYLGYI